MVVYFSWVYLFQTSYTGMLAVAVVTALTTLSLLRPTMSSVVATATAVPTTRHVSLLGV